MALDLSKPQTEVNFDNDVYYWRSRVKANTLPSNIQRKLKKITESKYSEVPSLYMYYPLKVALLKVLELDYIPIVLFTGDAGSGKTSGGLGLATWLGNKIGFPFNKERCFIVGKKQGIVIEDIDETFRYGDILFIDEIQHFIHRFRANSGENVEFGRFIDACRKFGIKGIFATSVRFNAVDSAFTNEQVQAWLHGNKKNKENQLTRFFQNINTVSISGKEMEFSEKGNLWLPWCEKSLYDYSVEQSVENLYKGKGLAHESSTEKNKRLEKEQKQDKTALDRANILFNPDLSVDQKAYALLYIGTSMKKTTGLLNKAGYDIEYDDVDAIKQALDLENMKKLKQKMST